MTKPKPELIEGLRKALDLAGNTHTLGDVADMIDRGDAQLWVSPDEDALMVSEIIKYPQKKAVRIWLATGVIDSVVELSEIVVDWAKDQGCSFAILTGRRGWERVGTDRGWRRRVATLTREL